jgi:2-methylisocitrate lyase-like PEP mutase family enzyme
LINGPEILKELLKMDEIIVAPGTHDPLTAKLVENIGFKCAYLGGWMTGARLLTTEPLTTLTEMTTIAKYITNAINIPLIVDGNAGFGDAVHTYRSVKEYESAGIAAMHIEDQIYPKRVSYHRNLKHIIPIEEMISKIEAALDARKNMLIIARTDAIGSVEGDVDEAIKRCKAYFDAGADIIMPSGSAMIINDLKRVSEEVDVPMLVLSPDSSDQLKTGGTRIPGQKISIREFENMGYKILIYALLPSIVTSNAIINNYLKLKNEGWIGLKRDIIENTKKRIEEALNFKKYWKMEDKTTEYWNKEK